MVKGRPAVPIRRALVNWEKVERRGVGGLGVGVGDAGGGVGDVGGWSAGGDLAGTALPRHGLAGLLCVDGEEEGVLGLLEGEQEVAVVHLAQIAPVVQGQPSDLLLQDGHAQVPLIVRGTRAGERKKPRPWVSARAHQPRKGAKEEGRKKRRAFVCVRVSVVCVGGRGVWRHSP